MRTRKKIPDMSAFFTLVENANTLQNAQKMRKITVARKGDDPPLPPSSTKILDTLRHFRHLATSNFRLSLGFFRGFEVKGRG